jgi:hypothetical protein
MARSGVTPKTKVTEEVAREIPWKPFVVVAVIAAAIFAIVRFDPQPPGVSYPSLGNQHIPSVETPHADYNSSPPSSGPHLGVLAEWRVHDEALPEELFIHNLEDGGVVFTYNCPDGCDDLTTGLGAIVEDGSRRLLTPYESEITDGTATYRAAAVAWTRVYYFDELTDDVRGDIDTFVGLYEGLDHHATTN